MVETQALDVLKDIPGYKAILKALIKSQIQHLVEQLSSHTDEECVLLSASLSDGSLSHLGSDFGKEFLDNHVDVKKQFLGFCLKKQLQVPDPSPETQPHMANTTAGYAQNDQEFRMGFKQKKNRFGPISGRPRSLGATPYGDFRPNKQSPVRMKFSSPTSTISHSPTMPTIQPIPSSINSAITDNLGESYNQIVKQEVQADFGFSLSGVSTPEQSGSQTQQFGNNDTHSENQTGFSVSNNGEDTSEPNESIVKLEPVNEDESDLEITGIELSSLVDSNWGIGNQSDVGDQTSENALSTNMPYIPDSFPYNPSFLPEFDGSKNFESGIGQSQYIQPQSPRDSNQKEKRFACTLCDRRFVRKDYLRKHMLLHTGEKPHKCAKCGSAFRQRSHLRMHLVKHAMGEYVQEALL